MYTKEIDVYSKLIKSTVKTTCAIIIIIIISLKSNEKMRKKRKIVSK